MNVSQVAEALGIQPGAVRTAIAKGKMAAIRMGGGETRAGFLLIERAEVERYRVDHLGKRGAASPDHPGTGGRPKKTTTTDAPGSSRTKDDVA